MRREDAQWSYEDSITPFFNLDELSFESPMTDGNLVASEMGGDSDQEQMIGMINDVSSLGIDPDQIPITPDGDRSMAIMPTTDGDTTDRPVTFGGNLNGEDENLLSSLKQDMATLEDVAYSSEIDVSPPTRSRANSPGSMTDRVIERVVKRVAGELRGNTSMGAAPPPENTTREAMASRRDPLPTPRDSIINETPTPDLPDMFESKDVSLTEAANAIIAEGSDETFRHATLRGDEGPTFDQMRGNTVDATLMADGITHPDEELSAPNNSGFASPPNIAEMPDMNEAAPPNIAEMPDMNEAAPINRFTIDGSNITEDSDLDVLPTIREASNATSNPAESAEAIEIEEATTITSSEGGIVSGDLADEIRRELPHSISSNAVNREIREQMLDFMEDTQDDRDEHIREIAEETAERTFTTGMEDFTEGVI